MEKTVRLTVDRRAVPFLLSFAAAMCANSAWAQVTLGTPLPAPSVTLTQGGAPNFADTFVTPFVSTQGGNVLSWKAQFIPGNLNGGTCGIPVGIQLKVLRPVPMTTEVQVVAAGAVHNPLAAFQAISDDPCPSFQVDTLDAVLEFTETGLTFSPNDIVGLTISSDPNPPGSPGYFYPLLASSTNTRVVLRNVNVNGTIDLADSFTGTQSNLVPALLVNLGNTSVGSDVSVQADSISLVFDNVTAAGDTTVTASASGPSSPSGFKLTNPPVYYEITTTATFSGNVRVCIGWVEGQVANEAKVHLFHFEGGQWADITDPTSRDTVNNVVCGTTTSFSQFTLMETKYSFGGFFQPVDNLPTSNTVKAGSAVPVKFSLGDDYGLTIFASGYPLVQLIQCPTGIALDQIEETVTAVSNSLSYDPVTGRYTYVWKTDKAWANSCRELSLKFDDGQVYTARFTMSK